MYEEGHFSPVSAAAATPIADLPAPGLSVPVADVPLPVAEPSAPVAELPQPLTAPPVAAPPVRPWPPTPDDTYEAEHPRPTIAVWQLLLIVAAVAALVAGVVVISSGGAQAAATVKVPIELRGWPGGPGGVMPIVRVSIDGAAPIPVLLDTGSTGLDVLAKDLPAQADTEAVTFSEAWGGGNLTTARPAYATISIAGVSTTHKIPIGAVQSVKCLPGLHHCLKWVQPGVDGILGIRVDPRFALTNPLAALPAPYNRSWSVGLSSAGGTLELGAPIPAHPTASFPLQGDTPADLALPQGLVAAPVPPGAKSSSVPTKVSLPGASGVGSYLTGMPTMCWRLGGRGGRRCVPTLFDTGSTDTILFSKHGGLPTRFVPAGRLLTAWASSTATTPLWSLTTGVSSSENVVVGDGHRVAVMDAGIAPFYAFTVTYDGGRGQMYLTPGAGIDGGAPWRHAANALCSSLATKDIAALKATPHVTPTSTLAEKERAEVYQLKALERLSAQGDDAFAKLALPSALKATVASALRSDRAGNRIMLTFAREVPHARSITALRRALARFQRQYKAVDGGWQRMLAHLKIAGCS